MSDEPRRGEVWEGPEGRGTVSNVYRHPPQGHGRGMLSSVWIEPEDGERFRVAGKDIGRWRRVKA